MSATSRTVGPQTGSCARRHLRLPSFGISRRFGVIHAIIDGLAEVVPGYDTILAAGLAGGGLALGVAQRRFVGAQLASVTAVRAT